MAALLARFRMTDAKHRLPGSFSKGMQQKMMLTLGLLPEPIFLAAASVAPMLAKLKPKRR